MGKALALLEEWVSRRIFGLRLVLFVWGVLILNSGLLSVTVESERVGAPQRYRQHYSTNTPAIHSAAPKQVSKQYKSFQV